MPPAQDDGAPRPDAPPRPRSPAGSAGSPDPAPGALGHPRVRNLLDALLSVPADLDLGGTLRRTVAAATDLVGARYGTLRVLAPDGGPAAVVSTGEDDGAGAVQPLPGTPGPPLPAAGVAPDPGPAGVAPPAVRSSLTVPVRVRGDLFATLHVTEGGDGGFTREDEAALALLAEAAGVAIGNVRLHEEVEQRRRWETAVSQIRCSLLSTASTDTTLTLVADRVAELTAADAAWLLTGPGADGGYVVRAQSGAGLPESRGATLTPVDDPLLGAVVRAGRVVLSDAGGSGLPGLDPHGGWESWLGVRLPGGHSEDAVVLAARRSGSPPFPPALAPLVGEFADGTAAALEMAARQRLAHQLDVYADRDRIAQDLHDHVIQRMFAAGLGLQSVLPQVPDAEARHRILRVVGQLEATVRDIRTTIFHLQSTEDCDADGNLRRRVLDIVTETTGRHLVPTVRMPAAVDRVVSAGLASDVEAVVREAVSNAARHSGGSAVTVTLDVADEVVLEVVDDGRGIGVRRARSGLRNLEARARRRGGGSTVEALPGGGTRLRWWAPVERAGDADR